MVLTHPHQCPACTKIYICPQAELSKDHVVRIVAIIVLTAVLVNEELLLKMDPADDGNGDEGDDAGDEGQVFVSGRDCRCFT